MSARRHQSHPPARRDERPSVPFVVFWRQAFLEARLPSTQKLTGLVYSIYCDSDGSNSWPSVKTAAHKASLAERSIQGALRELEATEWVRSSPRPGRTTVYELRLPEGVQELRPGVNVMHPAPAGDAPDVASERDHYLRAADFKKTEQPCFRCERDGLEVTYFAGQWWCRGCFEVAA